MNTRSRFVSIFTIALSTAALALGAAACSSSDDDNKGNGPGGNGGGSYTLDNVCEQVAKKECTSIKSCCESTGVGHDQAGCEAESKKSCEAEVAKAKAGKRTFNASAVDSCVASMQGLYQKCTFTYAELVGMGHIGASCANVFAGTVAEGGTCEDSEDCKPSSDSSKHAFCDEGKCVVGPISLAEGEDCGGGEVACGAGLYCDLTSMKCQKAKALGETCDPSSFTECGLGNYCDSQSTKCTAGKAEGADCTIAFECASMSCDNDKCGAGLTIATELSCKGVDSTPGQ